MFPENYQLHKSLMKNISLIIVSFFSQTNLVLKFNLTLIEWFSPQFIYLFTFKLM